MKPPHPSFDREKSRAKQQAHCHYYPVTREKDRDGPHWWPLKWENPKWVSSNVAGNPQQAINDINGDIASGKLITMEYHCV